MSRPKSVGGHLLPSRPERPTSYIRELAIPAGKVTGYRTRVSGTITPEHLKRVAAFIRSQYTADRDEAFYVADSGIPQSTWNNAARGSKLGLQTAARLAAYFGWGDDVMGFLNGTEPAGTYAPREGRLQVGYPKRGLVLDRFRGIVASGVLDEVQAIVLPPGSPDWTELDWARKVLDTANEWERLGKHPDPTNDGLSHVGGQGPRHSKRHK